MTTSVWFSIWLVLYIQVWMVMVPKSSDSVETERNETEISQVWLWFRTGGLLFFVTTNFGWLFCWRLTPEAGSGLNTFGANVSDTAHQQNRPQGNSDVDGFYHVCWENLWGNHPSETQNESVGCTLRVWPTGCFKIYTMLGRLKIPHSWG